MQVKQIKTIIEDGSSKGTRQKNQLKRQDQAQCQSNVKLSLLGVGLVFGDDDILTNRPYKASLKCVRNDSIIYLLQRDEFLRIFRTENETWNVQFSLSQKREIADLQMLNNYERIHQKILNSDIKPETSKATTTSERGMDSPSRNRTSKKSPKILINNQPHESSLTYQPGSEIL